MVAFTAQDVKSLREKTGCGMMDCKKALTQADGDMDAAIDFLREQGLAKQAKKSGRIAAEGVAYAQTNADNTCGVVIEVNAETDFVAKNADFQAFVKTCADTVMEQNPADVDALLECKASGSEETVAALLQEKVLTIGENIKIRRFVRYEGTVVTYIHAAGRIGVMVKFDTDVADKDEFKTYAKDIAMQVAAANPLYLNEAAVPADVIEHEKKILTEQVINEGKPAQIAEKIVMGKIGKYYKENCLVDQIFVKDGDYTVKKYTDKVAKDLGGNIAIVDFARFEKGEGLEKRQDNFAEEVAGMVK
ncbi:MULTISPECIES: translation elongation factor Ts [unclassified Ruminococcus]|uniref:translation elongation factor Ts n=1 Tax=unclassified Ruminococcus TaxID=2608920 RepID=UPI00210BD58D|nr:MULTISPECIES: translation elongation factor Ts [unclassified Ruminococcus]MCQ4021571.1 elongation factor Ts [Ruminococcus sp. zg-924]MCQ4114016.1 elongation factor Ts [Ruminococcus sp. zg-921]